MWFGKRIRLIALSFALFGCSPQPAPNLNPADAEMIFWEQQSWEVGGGRSRLTIWADGRSEVVVVPDAYFRRKPEMLSPRDGWTMKKSATGLYFMRNHVFSEKVAKNKFKRALAAGIHLLQTFKPDYVDGSGTLVGVQIDGKLNETIIPMFLDRHRGSANYKRFSTVSRVLSDIDSHAYDVQH